MRGAGQDSFILPTCKRCIKLWNDNYKLVMPQGEELEVLTEECARQIKQHMIGHSCGQERCIGGGSECKEKFFSSTCIGCCPDTQQHYRAAAELIIAWTQNVIERKVMKNILLKGSKPE